MVKWQNGELSVMGIWLNVKIQCHFFLTPN